jgi:hypothetical protein
MKTIRITATFSDGSSREIISTNANGLTKSQIESRRNVWKKLCAGYPLTHGDASMAYAMLEFDPRPSQAVSL